MIISHQIKVILQILSNVSSFNITIFYLVGRYVGKVAPIQENKKVVTVNIVFAVDIANRALESPGLLHALNITISPMQGKTVNVGNEMTVLFHREIPWNLK